MAAPSVDINSTYKSGYAELTGTSMATPHVTGAVALYLSLYPTATPTQVDDYLKSTGSKPTTLPPKSIRACDGNGRGYFSFQADGDNIREPLLYVGEPVCPPDCAAQQPDYDNDGFDDSFDNCPSVANPDQKDSDGDGI